MVLLKQVGKMKFGTFAKTISLLKYGTLLKKKFITLPNNKQTISICKTLFKNGLISGYFSTSNKHIIVTFKIINDKNVLYQIISKLNTGSKKRISISEVIKLKKTNTQNTTLLLSTNKGIVTEKEAFQMNVSGALLATLN